MTLLKTSLSLLFIVAMACNGTKTTTNDTTKPSETNMAETKKMMEAGFMKGSIVASAQENDCPFTIKLEDDNVPYLLDPINLEESFKKDGAKIWVKYAGLKMMNRCEKANPVNITDMQKRAE